MSTEIKNFEVLSIGIDTDYDTAFSYVADSNKLPEWTNQFVSVDGSSAKFDTLNGVMDVEFKTIASRESGTIDWALTLPDGSVGYAYSRLTRNVQGVIYAFNFIVPLQPADAWKEADEKQTDNIKNELTNLKAALEN
ncbi:MAG TPA: hypothetical protein VGN64_10470 [Dyadobacter sp.]|jgi:hypothetical protein|nr:hypothetical protein [Dyadobacter sp.]